MSGVVPGASCCRRGAILTTLRGSRLPRVKTCDFCGRQEADETTALTWSTAVEDGRVKTFCDVCSRDHLRAMEGKLDSIHW